jgi:diguanylate cyclase (GGDEF)-like protein
MSAVPTSWAAQGLTEFLASISSAADEAEAIRDAVERATEAFEAEVGAIVGDRTVLASSGFGAETPSYELLAGVVAGDDQALEVTGIGECQALATPIGDEQLEALVLARHGDEPFSSEERNLARGMGRVLTLTVRLLRVVSAERRLRSLSERQGAENERLVVTLAERQALLERLSKIQSSIVSRRDLDEVLNAIVEGAKDLLGDETAGLRLIDPDEPGQLMLAASKGVSRQLLRDQGRTPLGVGAGGRAAATGEMVVVEDYLEDPTRLAAFAEAGIRSALAVPVHEEGKVVGSLVVATNESGRRYSTAEREMLMALAEHASLALTDARTVEEKVHQAVHDSLTGLPNRALLIDRLEHALARAARSRSRVAVLFVDLDAFKNVNDTLGHTAGDELLCQAAERLLDCVRAADTVARFGGDEFVVLLEQVDEATVTLAADRILAAMNEPFEVRGRELFVGASVGIALGSDEADDLLRDADLALYRAKDKGKGRRQVFAPEMHLAMVERLELEEQLSLALQNDELLLHYQPVLDLTSQRLVGVEALVRWMHPTRGQLSPGEFIPVAEDSRLIGPLGRWVLRAACIQAAAWRAAYPQAANLAIAVNFSIAQFDDATLVDQVAEVLDETALEPQQLVLELTETAFLRDSEMVGERMRELKQLGVRLAVDDFGTGNASLRHLARFPVDVLKVDRSFVERIGIDRRQTAIASSIIGLGHSLEMSVVAEGIETADQLAKLVALGCELGQGFHLARPAPAARVEPLLARSETAPLAESDPFRARPPVGRVAAL